MVSLLTNLKANSRKSFIINCLRSSTDRTEVTKQDLRVRSRPPAAAAYEGQESFPQNVLPRPEGFDLSTRSLDFNGNSWSVPDFVGKTVRKQFAFKQNHA